LYGRVKDSGSRSWGLNADQPEDDERETGSVRRRRLREVEMGRRKEKEREERCKRGRYTRTREINPKVKNKKVKCAHTPKDGGDRTAPSIEGYIPHQMGRTRETKDGEGTTVSTVKGVNRVVGGQGNPLPLSPLTPYRIPRRGPFLTSN